MKHSVRHDLDSQTARKVARHALEGYAEQFAKYNPAVDWLGEDAATVSFAAKGMTIKGKVDLRPGEILIDLSVPFALKLFQKRAISVVEREINQWVGKAQRGEMID
jgi:hypothetical protein